MFLSAWAAAFPHALLKDFIDRDLMGGIEDYDAKYLDNRPMTQVVGIAESTFDNMIAYLFEERCNSSGDKWDLLSGREEH